ncbi:MAG: type II toxin-antitoxin system PemK/MazF family toxin [Jannaschia sp.]
MRRGDLVTVALSGDYGKPRPAVVIQSDLFEAHPSVTVLPLTSALRDAPLFRLLVEPSPETGLRVPSDVMVDKPVTVARGKVGETIGRLDAETQRTLDRLFAVFFGIAG